MKKIILKSLEDTVSVASWILDNKIYKIFTLKGNLGAGKTTLIKAIVRLLDSQDMVSSPTFSIVNEYNSENGKIYHFDLYRLKDKEELLQIGFDEYIDSGNFCFIEWPELAEDYLPEHHSIEITFENDKERILKFE